MKIKTLRGKTKKIVIVQIAVVCCYLLFTWDYHLSNFMFERLCSDSSKIGLFVYEKVELPDEYWEPLPSDWVHHLDYERDSRFEFPEGKYEEKIFEGNDNIYKRGLHYRFAGGYRINKAHFENAYRYLFNEYSEFSSVGAISLRTSSVVRISDESLVGKAVSAYSDRGWFKSMFSPYGGGDGTNCPSKNYLNMHVDLVHEIFIRK